MGRNPQALQEFDEFSPTIIGTSILRRTDIIILAVSDDAVADVAKTLLDTSALVVHTSGSVPMKALDRFKNHGVLYPLQTFTKNRELDISAVPFCLEANTAENQDLLYRFAQIFSQKVVNMTTEERAALHLSAVMANNFCNHLLALTEAFCKENNVPFYLLRNLMAETVAKAFEIGPTAAQTGPAKRGDYKTLEKHLKILEKNPLENIYKLMTNNILKTNGKAKL